MANYSEQETRRVEYTGYSMTDLHVGMEPIIEVLIPSLSPGALGGPVASGTDTSVLSFFDSSGNKQTAEVSTSNTVTAEWNGASNHKYAPLIKKKEQVKVFQIGNSDKFYWEPLGRDSNLRTLDRARVEWSATPVVGQEKTDDNTYHAEVDTVQGYARFKTSKANGEPAAYAINVDTKNGQFTVADDTGNKVFIDSVSKIIHLSNQDGSTVHLENKNCNVEVPEVLTIKAGKIIYLDAPVCEMNHGTSGVSGNRHSAASEDIVKMAEATAKAISEVAKAAKTSVDTSGITSNAASSKIENSRGV